MSLSMRAPLVALLAATCFAQHGAAQTATPGHVRVTSRIVVVEREAFTRAGLDYVVVGADRVRVSGTGRRAATGVHVQIGTHGVSAFLEAVRSNRWVRSESTQQVLTMSGSEAFVASTTMSVGRRATYTQGPSLTVVPTLLEDGRVHLRVFARVEDTATHPWGYGVDASPAAVETELIVRAGEEIIVGSSTAVESMRESGILRWGVSEQGRDVLVAITAQVIDH
jgi:hypothetical protein